MPKLNQIKKLGLMNFFLNLFFLSPVAVFFYQQRGLNYFQILFLESVLVLFIFFFEVPTGIFADKFGRKKSIIVGALLLAIEPLLFLFADNYYWFILAFAISGIGLTFHSGTIEALIYDYLKEQNQEKEMKKAMGRLGSSSLFAMVLAPMIGSYLAKDLLMSQFMSLIIMTLASMFIAFLLALSVKDTKQKKVVEDNPITIFKESAKFIKTNNSLVRIIFLSMFSSPFLFSLTYLYQPYFIKAGINASIFGSVFALALLLAALFQRYAYKFEQICGMKKAIFIVTILPGIFYLIMAITFYWIWAILLFIMIRAIIGLQQPLFSDYKNIHIPSKARATILSLISMLVSLYLVFMRLIIGKIADINLSYTFVFMGIIIIIASLFLRIDESYTNR